MAGVKQKTLETHAATTDRAPRISVVVPAHNPPAAHLRRLYDSLLAQTFKNFEVLVVDDASTSPPPYALLEDDRFRVIQLSKNRGPAAARNTGAEAAKSTQLFFTDADCALHPEALAKAIDALKQDEICVGDTVTEVVTPFGRAVALLGFPGGGALGFDRVWRVDEKGYTRSFSSCNLGIRKTTFEKLGRFNETLPVPGGEDTVLARHAVESGHKIRFVPEQVVYHVQRDTLPGFIRWQLVRGRGNYHIKQHVPEVGGYLRLRVWTFTNSLRAAGLLYAPSVTLLWVLSVTFQSAGFWLEKRRVSGGQGGSKSGKN